MECENSVVEDFSKESNASETSHTIIWFIPVHPKKSRTLYLMCVLLVGHHYIMWQYSFFIKQWKCCYMVIHGPEALQQSLCIMMYQSNLPESNIAVRKSEWYYNDTIALI